MGKGIEGEARAQELEPVSLSELYAANTDTARAAYAAFECTWAKRCPGVMMSLREGGDELLTFFTFPKAQWKTLRTTNAIERLHEDFAAA